MKTFKALAFAICMILFINANAQEHASNKINWMSFEEAVKLNETQPKKIFIDVYTDWCGWCTKMDQTTFTDQDIINYINENFYAVKFNAEQSESIEFNGHTFTNTPSQGGRKNTHQLAAALLQGKVSYPSYVFMNENNQLLTAVPGYADAKNFMPILKYFGSNAFKTMDWNEFSKQQGQ